MPERRIGIVGRYSRHLADAEANGICQSNRDYGCGDSPALASAATRSKKSSNEDAADGG
jgi:hypothetical protein